MTYRPHITRIFYGTIGAAASLALALLFYWSLLFDSSIRQFIDSTYGHPYYFWPYVAMTLSALALFGVNSAVLVYRWRRFGPPQFRSQTGTGAGALVGFVASACPACGSFILSLLGITGGLAAFPFNGLELKAASIVLLFFPIWLIWRDIRRGACGKDGVCPLPRDASYHYSDQPRLILLISAIIAFIIMGLSMFLTDPASATFFSNNTRIVAGAVSCKAVRY